MALKSTLTRLPVTIPYQCSNIVLLESYVGKFYDAVPLAFLKWDLQADNSYLYQIKAVDGRLWKQVITPIAGDSLQTFQISDAWKLSEFTLQRPIRDLLLQMSSDIGLTNLSITFAVV